MTVLLGKAGSSIARGLGGALMCAVLITGCSSDPEPIIADPTETAEPTETTPPEPTTPQTPEEFVDAFIEATNQQNLGDTASYRALTQACPECTGESDNRERIYANGGYIKGRVWTLVRIVKVRAADTTTPVVTFVVDESPSKVKASADAPETKFPKMVWQFTAYLKVVGDGLQMQTGSMDAPE